ncbi:T9SS type A sorting domain-containing protein [Emticicia oligotrophica]|uniref:T9SS type A sorting domain-containing protein n=1 Tax=Emticicia oligotrophica TaxID=312279 RepID=UPI00273BE4AF|nr:T9SS type A sorting domain-containing protein [Emticicia oligotrophica]
MKIKFLLFFILLTIKIQAQRTLVYPVILVHGWTGDVSTFSVFTDYLKTQANLSISSNYLNYNLNCDNNIYTSNLVNDVCDYTSTIGNHDVYIVNFNSVNVMSNQSGIVKQGYALKFAISRVLNATGADKVVLLGHSMGGLAIREYLQNPSNWQFDGRHHLAKIATIGTPHGGSNSTSWNLFSYLGGGDENSESVRDLRESYTFAGCTRNGQSIQCPGVYLWGGQENKAWMKTNALGQSNFYNLDVNCNGVIGENIVGLNQKSISTDLDFACVIGGPNNSDFVVTVTSQNINNYFQGGLGAELFYYDCLGSVNCHKNEVKDAKIQMIQALDEPKKYPATIGFGRTVKGFFTSQNSGSNIDIDDYTINVTQRGIVSISANSYDGSNGRIIIRNQNGVQVLSQFTDNGSLSNFEAQTAGIYTISFSGNSLGGWNTYSFSLGFCGLPAVPTISANAQTTFCEGQSIDLSSNSGYDEYKWFKDGIQQTEFKTNQITVKNSGNFTVEAFRCGVKSLSTNTIKTTVQPLPTKPTINKQELLDKFILTSSSSDNNQWFLNDKQVSGATNQIFEPQELGSYIVSVSKEGCSNNSDFVKVSMEKPTLELVGLNPICQGDSSKIMTGIGFGKYIFSDGNKDITSNNNDFWVKTDGKYTVMTQRGKFLSPVSDPINIKVNPKPIKPTIFIESFGLKSSSEKNNQWYLDNNILKDSTNQIIRNSIAGAYMVRVTENGCSTDSEIFVITSTEFSEDFKVKLYPNPNEGRFWVEIPAIFDKCSIDILNIEGKLILNKNIKNHDGKVFIDFNFQSGSYILKISNQKYHFGVKFIVN